MIPKLFLEFVAVVRDIEIFMREADIRGGFNAPSTQCYEWSCTWHMHQAGRTRCHFYHINGNPSFEFESTL
jgi:hypothetical protein